MNETKLAYIAGLFDGEGDLGVYPYRATKNGKYYRRLQVRISNTDRRALDFVKEVMGFGRIDLHKPNNPKWSLCYRYACGNKNAKNFLVSIRPWLKIRDKDVDKLLASPLSGVV